MYSQSKLFKRNRTFYIWLFSYLVIFSIPFIFSIFSYIISVKLISYESLYHKKAIQTQMKNLADQRFSEINRLTNQIIWDRQIRFYLKTDKPNEDFRNSIEKRIKELRFLNKYIDQIYIVNENIETSSEKSLFPRNFQSSGIDWKSISDNKGRPFIYDDIDRNHEGNELCIITRFFMVDERDSGIYLVVLVNQSFLEDIFSEIEWIDYGAGFVIDNNGSVIASRVNIKIDDSIAGKADELLNKYKDIDDYIEIREDHFVISLLKSDFLDLYYVIIVPETVYYGKIKQFQSMISIIFLICLSAGIYLSWIFSLKRYLPILSLVKLFSTEKANSIYLNYTNEFEILETEIKSVINENISVKETFNKNKEGLKKLFLRRLVMGEEIESSVVLDIGSSIGIDFIYEYFSVLIIESTDNNSDSFLILKKELDKELNKLEDQFNCFIIAYAGKNIGILNIETPDDYSLLSRSLEELALYLRERIKENFLLTAGKIYDSISGISMSYSEALQVLDYRTLLGEKEIHLFTELKALKQNHNFKYLSYLEDEYKTYNLLTARNYEEARNLLLKNLEVIEENVVDIQILKIRLSGFKNIIIESLNTIIRNDPDNLKTFINKIISSQSFLQLKTDFDYVLTELKKNYPEKISSDLFTNAKNYIMKNYSDKNLSVTVIAEKLGITPQHLSKIFKEINGTGPLQYINTCRIEEAKKILVNEYEISIKDTSNLIGYYNEITFIRNFKNLTGLSPGKYRKVMGKKQDILD